MLGLRLHRGLGTALLSTRRLFASRGGSSQLEQLRSNIQRLREDAAASQRVQATMPERYLPLPLSLRPHAAVMENYVVNTWVNRYPQGARLRKLQRDLAFHLPKVSLVDGSERHPGKLDVELIQSFADFLAEKGLIKLIPRVWKGHAYTLVVGMAQAQKLEAESAPFTERNPYASLILGARLQWRNQKRRANRTAGRASWSSAQFRASKP